MNKQLITSIAEQYGIRTTNDREWICQTVYSLAGQMALASLWDHTDDESAVSIQHFKSRIQQIFDAYIDIYPEIEFAFSTDKTELIQEIYSIYLRSGYLYHSSYYLSPCISAAANYGDLTLFRGSLPENKYLISGLGFYTAQKFDAEKSIVDLFGLQTECFELYLEEILSFGDWETIEWPENTEFLRLEAPFTRGYWKLVPDKDHQVSIARYGAPNKLYVFYYYQNGVYYHKPIPDWRIRDYFHDESAGYGEYRRIAAALLKQRNVLPEIHARRNGGLVEIKLGYRLPPSEEAFFKLYSWPINFNSSQVFSRKMAERIYPVFKHELESMGYRFVEV